MSKVNMQTELRTDSLANSAATQAYDTLRDQIISMQLPPGTVLSRPELSHKFGVSQTPIRDALTRLEQDGLITIRPQSKTVVKRIDMKQLFEMHFLRVAVETDVVGSLAQSMDENAIARLRAILNMQKALSGDIGQMDLFNTQDRVFHKTLFQAAGVENLFHMLASKTGHLARCQRLDLPKQGKMDQIINDHTAIIDAIACGDSKNASSAMRKHLSGTINRVEALRAEYPDYFTTDINPIKSIPSDL